MYGCQELVKSKCSDAMLLRIFDRMDLGDDHLGKVTSDRELTYKEFQKRMDYYQVPTLTLTQTLTLTLIGWTITRSDSGLG